MSTNPTSRTFESSFPFLSVLIRCLMWGSFIILIVMAFMLSGRVGRTQSERIEQFRAVASEVEILSFGTSHAQAIHFPTLDRPGHAFFDSNGDLQVVDLKIRSILDRVPKLKYAIVVISPGLLGAKKNRSETNGNLRWLRQLQNLPFYPTASGLTIKERWDIFNAHYGVLRIQQVNQWVRNRLRFTFQSLQTPISDQNSDPLDCRIASNPSGTPHEFGIARGYPRAAAKPECIKTYLRSTLERHASNLNKSKEEIEQIGNQNLDRLQRLGRLLRERGAHLVLVQVPYTKEYFYAEQTQKFVSQDRPLLKQLSSSENVTFLDFHDFFFQSNYQIDNRYFFDDDHLAVEGAKSFSKALLEKLSQVFIN